MLVLLTARACAVSSLLLVLLDASSRSRLSVSESVGVGMGVGVYSVGMGVCTVWGWVCVQCVGVYSVTNEYVWRQSYNPTAYTSKHTHRHLGGWVGVDH